MVRCSVVLFFHAWLNIYAVYKYLHLKKKKRGDLATHAIQLNLFDLTMYQRLYLSQTEYINLDHCSF